MTDDQGWGDVGYRDHPRLKTPHLDAMASEGVRFERFYAAAPVCSPTRGSCLTGRHPFRYGVFGANRGHLAAQEQNLAMLLRARGYRTGHFGKWHLGVMTTEHRDSNRGGKQNSAKHYAPPWERGFDVCFSTEAKVPTFDPMKKPGSDEPYGTAYWDHTGARVTENLEGDDSRVIMDRVVPFVRDAARREQPFFAVVWFHAPHLPVIAGPDHLARYADVEDRSLRHYFGCVAAIDDQIGRLRRELEQAGVARDTMLWFCSDNGPEGRDGRAPGTQGPLRGRKRSLYEGGVRVPASLVWPARLSKRVVDTACTTSDYVPTVLDALGVPRGQWPARLDGVSLLPVLAGETRTRSRPICFEHGKAASIIEGRYKLIRPKRDAPWELYDLVEDPREAVDIASDHAARVRRLRRAWEKWHASCDRSRERRDVRVEPVTKKMRGWIVHVDPALLDGPDAEEGARALSMLDNHLERIALLVDERRRKELQSLEIWIEHEHEELWPMQYHPSAGWLRSKGYDERLAKKVHIPRARDLLSRAQLVKHPAVILHELAHAYHDQVLGFGEEKIVAAFEAAKEARSYVGVMAHTGKKVLHYAMSNHKEYFAEGTEAYLYRNDFYPFVRAELAVHDPGLHAVMVEVWGELP